MYPVYYLCSKTTTRVPNPGPTTKLVGIMAQDSVPKKRKEKGEEIHTLLKIRSNLKKIQIYAIENGGRKARNSVQQKEIELIQPKLSKKIKIHLN